MNTNSSGDRIVHNAQELVRRTIQETNDSENHIRQLLEQEFEIAILDRIRDPELFLKIVPLLSARQRSSALMLAASYWNWPNATDICEYFLNADSSVDVRASAVTWLSHGHRGLGTKDVISKLYQIVVDDHQSTQLRTAAYFGLYTIHGRYVFDRLPKNAWLNALDSFRFPKDVNWDFVAQCHVGGDKGER